MSSTTPTPSSSPSSSSSGDKSDKGTIILAACLSVLAFFLFIAIFFFTWRMRRRAKLGLEGFHNLDRQASVVGPRHLASRITPFGTRDAHQPGRNMRVATRRPDGAWDFSVPATPINPFGGTDDPEPEPAPRPRRTKEYHVPGKLQIPRKTGSTGYLDPDGLKLPPPAYSPTDDSILKQ